jgi:23S rRNA (pseudouridine1915-N3)-methyltransferase
MKVTLLAIAKTKDTYLLTGMQEYQKRLKRYATFEYKELTYKIKTDKRDTVLAKEQELIEQHAGNGTLILFDEIGKQHTSVEFGNYISKLSVNGQSNLVFVIGGAYGFSDALKKKAFGMVSLSKMTFTHQMVRLIALEQIYRAFTIIKGEKYHH